MMDKLITWYNVWLMIPQLGLHNYTLIIVIYI